MGVPRGDSLLLLGLESTFSFGDALRHLRRLDATLIDSAFTTSESGLRILAYAEADDHLEQSSAAELYMLLSALRQHFPARYRQPRGPTGQRSTALAGQSLRSTAVVHRSERSGCRRNLTVLNNWREKGMKMQHASLLVDRYLRSVAPNSETLGKTFGLPVLAVLPLAAELRLNAKNQGITLFELASRDALCTGVRRLGEHLARHSESQEKSDKGWLARLWGNK